jgi:hypothetical protein
MPGIEFAHAHHAKSGQVRLAIGVAARQLAQLGKVFCEIEGDFQEFIQVPGAQYFV